MRRQLPGVMLILSAAMMVAVDSVHAGRISDIQNTRHNFSATVIPSGVTRTAAATSESQICAFCHTPHGATVAPKAPIWNRTLSSATYILFNSGSLDATDLGQPGDKSKLCLSCHDGTLALGAVNVLNRVELKNQNQTVPFTGTMSDGTIPEGQGATTGFTRRLGVDLTNDHPISFTYDSAQAARDGELRDPATITHIAERVPGVKPDIPLEDNKVECISCHDPHIRSDLPGENAKFLRLNRFQAQAPVEGAFSTTDDIICLGCHDKAGWVGSAHANVAVADERYTEEAVELREFTRDIRVWQAACLNCHDTHTVQGARRILREGTDGPLATTSGGAKFRQGGNPAIEQVCYTCHSADGGVLQGQGAVNFEAPDIKTDFTTMLRRMPIASIDQPAGFEVHDIGTGDSIQGDQRGKDFIESRENLGKGNLNNRHAECTDCHNPHRVMKNRLFNADNIIPDAAGTHQHEDGVPHTNLASGVLRGTWGVEPVYATSEFGSEPVSFEVKRGDPGAGASTAASAPHVTREYQVCLKCHSNYAYDQPPLLGSYTGGTSPGTNQMTRYTNQGMEYQTPAGHEGEGTAPTPTGAFVGTVSCNFAALDTDGVNHNITGTLDENGGCANLVDYNHRSWHPATNATGRTPAVRKADADDWRSPFNAAVGTQTMYCTDCHGSSSAPTTVEPNGGEDGSPWGPHGSNDNFLLKGAWDNQTGEDRQNHLCFRCHDYRQYGRGLAPPYANPAFPDQVRESGFRMQFGSGAGCLPFKLTNLHVGHASIITNFRCVSCHVAVPHGWKNKTFLANLNDVGLEAPILPGETPNSAGSRQVRVSAVGTAPRYYNGPYYNGAALKVRYFSRSGEWTDANCGSSGPPGNGMTGFNWMFNGNEACSNLP
ncbi:MAG TPA: cytochrome c3 family protein [Gammaproteobacteria bacterium]